VYGTAPRPGQRPGPTDDGPDVDRRFRSAGLLDEVHRVVVPALLGSGERFFDGSEPDSLRVVEFTPSRSVTHVRLRRDA
jgi:dihydrofolate reductase